jgi:hypothetical protein
VENQELINGDKKKGGFMFKSTNLWSNLNEWAASKERQEQRRLGIRRKAQEGLSPLAQLLWSVWMGWRSNNAEEVVNAIIDYAKESIPGLESAKREVMEALLAGQLWYTGDDPQGFGEEFKEFWS